MLDKKDLPKILVALLAFILIGVFTFAKLIPAADATSSVVTIATVLIGGLAISTSAGKLAGPLSSLLSLFLAPTTTTTTSTAVQPSSGNENTATTITTVKSMRHPPSS